MNTPRKYEIETSNMIHDVESSIVKWAREELGFYPSIRINPELYYANDGRPSRYLTLYFGRGSEMRISVERQLNKRAKWICYWAVFTSGRSGAEGQFDATGIAQIAPEITKKIIGRYEYALK